MPVLPPSAAARPAVHGTPARGTPARGTPPTPPAGRRGRLGVRGVLVLLVCAVVLPFVVLTGLRLRDHAADVRRDAEARALETAMLVRGEIVERARDIHLLLGSLGHVVRPDAAFNDSTLLAVRRTLPDSLVTNLWVYDTTGRNVGTSRRPLPTRASIDVRDRRYFREALATRRFTVGNPVRGRPDSTRWSVSFALPVPVGAPPRLVVLGTVHLAGLAGALEQVALPVGSVVTVLDGRGTVLARTRDGDRWVGRDVSGFPTPQEMLQRADGVRELVGIDGVRRLSAYTRVPEVGWHVYVGIPRDVALAPVWRALLVDASLAALALAVALALALLLARRLLDPLDRLAADAQALAAGHFRHEAGDPPRPPIGGPRELDALAATFDEMAATIAARTAQLHRSEQRYRLLFEACPLPMYLVDLSTYRFLAVNDAAVAQYGWSHEEFAALTLLDIRPPEDRLKFLAVARSLGKAQEYHDRTNAGVWRHLRRNGSLLEVEVFTAVTEYEGRPARLSVAADVTARRIAERGLQESQEQLRRMQKMEALGRFAGGIAHDFNNLLTGILGYCDLAIGDLDDTDPGAPVREDFAAIRTAAQRAAALTGQILSFSRGHVVQTTAVELNAVVGGLESMLRRVIGEHIALRVALADGLGSVIADRGQLEQIVMNLALNARDAMPHGGTLTVSTGEVRVLAADPAHAGVPAGRWVRLVVRDTGIGMDGDTQARIFEPFFTTKERGKGTGLGLATVYGIVRQGGGVVRVDSEPGSGSTFGIYLPLADGPADPPRPDHPPAAAPPRRATGETILLAEDEESVRAITREILVRRGYRVLAAADGPSAIDLARRHGGPIDLLLTDVVMPGMSGRELAELLTRDRPGLRVLFASGYTEDEVLHRGVAADGLAFVAKPFTADGLAARVRALLDESAPVGALALG